MTKDYQMEYENNILDEPVFIKSENDIKIYSKRVIYGFSFLCSAIFGGVLLMQNLRDIGKKREGYLVLIFSLVYTTLAVLIVNNLENRSSSFSFLLNIIGAGIMSEYFFKKYFPSPDDYQKKKIWKPLIIAVLVIALLIAASMYDLDN
jgi:hypothetical protein